MTKTGDIKCNCTVCGARFRVKTDRVGNISDEPVYCVFCRALLEEVDPSKKSAAKD